ncbi:hypothetical protein [Sporosarcina sp. FSL W7-1283]|uniref:hypothetical protein n=1 Tax=Sporosarcina sp. FSL W7-1283 TaxID=2921560 RepID=UPI0030FACA65
METMQITLYKSSIEELEEYKALLKEEAELVGLESECYDVELDHLARFAILQALELMKEKNRELKRKKEGS